MWIIAIAAVVLGFFAAYEINNNLGRIAMAASPERIVRSRRMISRT